MLEPTVFEVWQISFFNVFWRSQSCQIRLSRFLIRFFISIDICLLPEKRKKKKQINLALVFEYTKYLYRFAISESHFFGQSACLVTI